MKTRPIAPRTRQRSSSPVDDTPVELVVELSSDTGEKSLDQVPRYQPPAKRVRSSAATKQGEVSSKQEPSQVPVNSAADPGKNSKDPGKSPVKDLQPAKRVINYRDLPSTQFRRPSLWPAPETRRAKISVHSSHLTDENSEPAGSTAGVTVSKPLNLRPGGGAAPKTINRKPTAKSVLSTRIDDQQT
jgi:hypothetical protein